MEETGRYSPWGCEESDTTERLHFHYWITMHGLCFPCWTETEVISVSHLWSLPQEDVRSAVLQCLSTKVLKRKRRWRLCTGGERKRTCTAPICFLWKVCSIFSSESLALVTSLASGSTDSKTDLVFTLWVCFVSASCTMTWHLTEKNQVPSHYCLKTNRVFFFSLAPKSCSRKS